VPAHELIFLFVPGKADVIQWVRQRHALLKQLESKSQDL